jgi:hypothetical protein
MPQVFNRSCPPPAAERSCWRSPAIRCAVCGFLLPELTGLFGTEAYPFTPLFDLGFGNPYLINDSVPVAYALDTANDPDGIEIGTAALGTRSASAGTSSSIMSTPAI